MSTLENLIAADAEVERGWCQHMAVDLDGNVCGLGAVETALGRPKSARVFVAEGVLTSAPVRALQNVLPAGYQSVGTFNDEPGRTKAEVRSLFARAINAEAVRVTDPAHTYSVAA